MFERLKELVVRGLTWKTCYLDDIIVIGREFEERLKNLQEVFNSFQAVNLNLNPKNCGTLPEKVEFLGHTVSVEGIQTTYL